MPTEIATYNYLSCAGKVDNLLHPRCGFLSDGGWEDLDTVRKRALVAGWTSPTKTSDLCPIHSQAIREVPPAPRAVRQATAVRQPEPTPAPTPAPEHHEHQQ